MAQLSRTSLVAGLTLAALIAASGPAAAAMCAHWEPPATVTAGSSASIAFDTFVPMSTGGDRYRLERYAFPDYPFRVRAVSPDGTAQPVEVQPVGSSPWWSGAFVPSRSGEWTLRIENFPDAEPRCYTDALLAVDERSSGDPSAPPILGALLAVIAAVGGFLLIRRHRAERPIPD